MLKHSAAVTAKQRDLQPTYQQMLTLCYHCLLDQVYHVLQ